MPRIKYKTDEERRAANKLAQAKWRANNKPYLKAKAVENRDRINANAHKRYLANPEKFRNYQRKWKASLSPEKRSELRAESVNFYKKNPNYRKEYYQANKQDYVVRARKYHAQRYESEPEYKILKNLRCRIAKEIRKTAGYKGIKVDKTASTIELLGCTIPEFLFHLHKQWKPRMDWTNYGFEGWHADHIKPCSHFNMSKPEDQKACWHYTNFQPLWAHENLRKSNKLPLESLGINTETTLSPAKSAARNRTYN